MNGIQRLVPVMLLAGATALTACGSGDDSTGASAPTAASTATPTTPPPPVTTTTATPTTPADGIDTLAGASTKPVVVRAANQEIALLTAVRAARHEGYDRVVFEFRNALPGYDVRYVRRPIRQDGSGRVEPVDGAFVVQVRMENALDADLSKGDATPTYTGPRRFSPGLPVVAELVLTGGFEGVLTWVAGLRDRVGFRVTTLDNPPRLVVDFRNRLA
jgi:hypothetical protein